MNWPLICARASNSGCAHPDEVSAARSWTHCPVSQIAGIRRMGDGAPFDERLWVLGHNFHTLFAERFYDAAAELLPLIEARGREILEGVGCG